MSRRPIVAATLALTALLAAGRSSAQASYHVDPTPTPTPPVCTESRITELRQWYDEQIVQIRGMRLPSIMLAEGEEKYGVAHDLLLHDECDAATAFQTAWREYKHRAQKAVLPPPTPTPAPPPPRIGPAVVRESAVDPQIRYESLRQAAFDLAQQGRLCEALQLQQSLVTCSRDVETAGSCFADVSSILALYQKSQQK